MLFKHHKYIWIIVLHILGTGAASLSTRNVTRGLQLQKINLKIKENLINSAYIHTYIHTYICTYIHMFAFSRNTTKEIIFFLVASPIFFHLVSNGNSILARKNLGGNYFHQTNACCSFEFPHFKLTLKLPLCICK